MKNLKIWSLLAVLFMGMAACEPIAQTDDFKAGELNVVGEWKLTEWDGETAPFDVYIDFNEDFTFAIYQRIYGTEFEMFDGTFYYDGNLVKGFYNKGDAREFSYDAAVSVDATLMRLANSTNGVKGLYEKTEIPADVKAVKAPKAASATRAAGVPFL